MGAACGPLGYYYFVLLQLLFWGSSALAEGVDRELAGSPEQTTRLNERLEELPEHIRHHPVLAQKHLWIGKPPMHYRRDTKDRRNWMLHKRDGVSLPSEEICQTTTQWEQLNRTQDYDGRQVEIVQDEIQQYVFSYRCVSTKNACNAISATYDSECTERKGWMYLYYRPLEGDDRNARWGYVSVNHHCVCKVTPKGVV
ncbi:uncharacterized protein LOC135400128 [Ornithodoros turicata]|uniref:uncharacterized protein LOC135400128 n=1 Tax=Ornithodoros turicata TaxID=34597 RepID=UPI00313879DB